MDPRRWLPLLGIFIILGLFLQVPLLVALPTMLAVVIGIATWWKKLSIDRPALEIWSCVRVEVNSESWFRLRAEMAAGERR